MAQIVTITNPLTGQPTQVDQLEHTAQQIDDAIARALPGGAIDMTLQKKVNPNLLDNWYFLNPVNQRGKTTYGSLGANPYTIDRWRAAQTNADTATVEITNNGINIKLGTNNGLEFSQRFEPERLPIIGKVVTLSVCVDGIVYSVTNVVPFTKRIDVAGKTVEFSVMQVTDNDTTYMRVYIMPISKDLLNLRAMKLELGSQQTLAHQDANGNWVLNEIPDYGEQLARCQRYFQLYSSADIRPAKAVDCRPTMRADPAQGTVVVNGTTYYYNNADL